MKNAIVSVVLWGCFVSVAAAQDRSHWGVSGAIAPSWTMPSQLAELFDRDIDLKGGEFKIGFVRGRELGGDWGVSFLRKSVKDGSTVTESGQLCSSGTCVPSAYYVTRSVTMIGLEAHKYVAFATIRERVQIGMNFGVGFAKFRGEVIKHRNRFDFVPATGQTFSETTSSEDPSELLGIATVPVGKVEFAVAGIVAARLKVRASGGINLPGYQVLSVTAVYFFGGR